MANEDKRLSSEDIKEKSLYLRYPVNQEVENGLDYFSKESMNILKFHGIYQQDFRDVRKERKAKGLGPEYMFMVRVGSAGGIYTAEQYLAMDELADLFGNCTLRLTSRQTIHFHGLKKQSLKPLIRALNKRLLSSFAKCGDLVRNIASCPAPSDERIGKEIYGFAEAISRRLNPTTHAFYEIWLDDELAVTAGPKVEEPLYGKLYLPRKFKIAIAYPSDNCVNVYANDVGIIPVIDERLQGFVILVGGGLGFSRGNRLTHPCLADPLCFVKPQELVETIETIVKIQRDNGNREDRSHARMKYLVERWGILRFKDELERILGKKLAPPKMITFENTSDHLGWNDMGNGTNMLGLHVMSGRIKDNKTIRMKSGLKAIVAKFHPGIRLTPQQNILLTNIKASDVSKVEGLVREYGILLLPDISKIKRYFLACVALPTCSLAITEAERISSGLVEEFEKSLKEIGLENIPIEIRVSGCANGCSRPLTAEIGIVGRSLKSYSIYLGGGRDGSRLGTLFMDNVPRSELMDVLKPIFYYYAQTKIEGETFGDFYNRVKPIWHG